MQHMIMTWFMIWSPNVSEPSSQIFVLSARPSVVSRLSTWIFEFSILVVIWIRDEMSEALSRIQIEQFQRRKEAAELKEKITELSHDLEQHVTETEKTKTKLDQDILELQRVETLYDQTGELFQS